MNGLSYLVPAMFLTVIGIFLFRRVRFGSWTGAFLGATIQRSVGEVRLDRAMLGSTTLKVSAMQGSDAEMYVGVTLVSKAALSISMTPLKMSRHQALELCELLRQAAA